MGKIFLQIIGVITIIIIIKYLFFDHKKMKKMKQKSAMNKLKYKDIIDKVYNFITSDEELNKYRHEQYKEWKSCIILFIFGMLLLLIFVFFDYSSIFYTIFYIIHIFLIAMSIVFFMKVGKNPYDKMYKEKLIKFALKEFDNKLEYYPEGCIPEQQYKMANFEHYDRYYSEDRINGEILEHNFMLAEVQIEEKREDSKGDTIYATLFNGPVAIIELSKDIEFNLTIKNNSIKFSNLDKIVEIDNPEFEKIYDVYADDPVKAMVVLTPAVTNRMLDLYYKYGFIFELKIIKNNMYFRFHTGRLFIPGARSAKSEAINIAKYFEIIDGIKEIIKEALKATESVRD